MILNLGLKYSNQILSIPPQDLSLYLSLSLSLSKDPVVAPNSLVQK